VLHLVAGLFEGPSRRLASASAAAVSRFTKDLMSFLFSPGGVHSHLPIDFDFFRGETPMVRAVCEGSHSLDVRVLHRKDLLRPKLWFDWSWTRNNEPAGNIGILTEHDAIILIYRFHRYGSTEWRDIQQRVPITWTECHLGGRRPWFRCTVYARGRYCGRRVNDLRRRRCVCVPALLWPSLRKSAGSGALPRVSEGAENQDALGRRSEHSSGVSRQAEGHALEDIRPAALRL
jgi:hypothetical protein